MITGDADEVDADMVMDMDEEDEEGEETLHEDEAREGQVDAGMVPVIPTLLLLKDVPPISSLHHHHSSCFFQVCLLKQLPLPLLHSWKCKAPLLAMC